jgi:hypothetical protein
MPATKFTATVDVAMTAAQTNALDKAIQATVLQHIAKIDNGVILGRKFDLGPITRGIWIKNFKTLGALKLNAAFKKAALPVIK